MKDPSNRTKVVLRHLPPSLPQSSLLDHIDSLFYGRYKWLRFRPGKTSLKHHKHSRAYVDFKTPEDVVEFAEVFDGHLFVNEKGSQFKILVEYSPSQRVPKQWSKKDGREGTIFKDPEYVEFLELLAKPVENLPSAEIQLERREAVRIGAAKEMPIVTPLMDFIRQKRAAKDVGQRLSSNEKLSRRSVGSESGKSSSASTRQGSEKRRVSISMYGLRDSAKHASVKDKSTYILVPREDRQQLPNKSASVAAATRTEMIGDESDGAMPGDTVAVDPGKTKILLLRGKECAISHVSGGVSQQQKVTSPVKNSPGSTTLNQSQRREASERMIRSILSNKEAHQNQSSIFQSEQKIQNSNLEKVKRPPRRTNMCSVAKDHLSTRSQAACVCDEKKASDDKIVGNDLNSLSSINEKQEKCTRNKDRPDPGVWTPLRRLDGSDASDDSSSSLATNFVADSLEGTRVIQHVAKFAVTEVGDDVIEDLESTKKSAYLSGKPQNMDKAVSNSQLGCGGNSLSAYDLPLSHGEVNVDLHNTSRNGEPKTVGSGRCNFSSVENGSHRQSRQRAHGVKDVNGTLYLSTEGKPSKRGGATCYGSHEKQVWVQKSGSGT